MSWEKLSMHKNNRGMGFKDLAAFNVAMLGEQVWKFHTKIDSLVARIFKACYYPNNRYLGSKLGHNPSFVWKSILNAKIVIMQGARCRTGLGHNIPLIGEP